MEYGVFYKGRLEQTFKSIDDAKKYVKKELRDNPNANSLSISQLKEKEKNKNLSSKDKEIIGKRWLNKIMAKTLDEIDKRDYGLTKNVRLLNDE